MTHVHNILFIIFIDAVCGAIFLVTVPNYIMLTCKNHIYTGILACGMYSFKRISESLFQQFFKQVFYGSIRISLLCSIFIHFITFLILMLTNSITLILICRFIHALTNGTVNYCKSLINSMKAVKETTVNRLIEAVICVGCIVGFIFGAYIYDTTKKFYCVAGMAAIFAFINLSLIQNLKFDYRENHPNYMDQCKRKAEEKLQNLQNRVNHRQYYKLILLKCFYSASVVMCFQKCPFLLNAKYKCSRVSIALVLAFEQILKFTTNMTLSTLTNQKFCQRFSLNVFKIFYFLYMVAIISLFLTTNFSNFLIVFFFLIITRTVNDNCWKRCLHVRPNTVRFDLLTFYTDLVGVILPLCFGVLCQFYGIKTFRLVFFLPIVSIVTINYNEAELVTTTKQHMESFVINYQ